MFEVKKIPWVKTRNPYTNKLRVHGRAMCTVCSKNDDRVYMWRGTIDNVKYTLCEGCNRRKWFQKLKKMHGQVVHIQEVVELEAEVVRLTEANKVYKAIIRNIANANKK